MAGYQYNPRCMRPGMEYSNNRKSYGCENSCRTSPYNKDSLTEFSIAMAYVPWQKWRNICELEKAFQNGTIFNELNKPFCGKGGVRR